MATKPSGYINQSYKNKFKEQQEDLYEFLSKTWVLMALTVIPALALFTFVFLIPIGWALWASLHDIHALDPEWTWTGTSNYVRYITDSGFQLSIYRSIVFAAGSVALQLVAGTALALLLNREFKFNKLARAIAFVPYMVPAAVLGFIVVWIGNSDFGIFNQILLDLGLINERIAWFGHPDFAMISVIVANSWKFSIFVTIMVLARLQSIPSDHYEAAQMAGASAYQQFKDITLPNLKGIIFIVLLLRGIWMFNKFDIIWVTTRGGPGDTTTTAPIYVYEIGFARYALGEAAAIASILFIVLISGAILYFKVLEPSEAVRVE